MSGYTIVIGHCFMCKRRFGFNPYRVPSIPIDPVTNRPPDLGGDVERAEREPLCETCVGRINERRARDGRPLVVILPGAYDPHPAEEDELLDA